MKASGKHFTLVRVRLQSKIADQPRTQILESWIEKLQQQPRFKGFLGLHEATVLPQTRSLEIGSAMEVFTDPTLDLNEVTVDFYFDNDLAGEDWRTYLVDEFGLDENLIQREGQENRDWNAEWRKSFTGVKVAPFWKIVPVWQKNEDQNTSADEKRILLNPGMGFGAGTHPTTQLILQAIGSCRDLSNQAILDFGSGSGILAVAAALLGARVMAIEIDPDAILSAKECFDLNHVQDRIEIHQHLEEIPVSASVNYQLILANILRPVLVEFADELVQRLKAGGRIWLSGLLESDLDQVIEVYRQAFLKHFHLNPQIQDFQKGEWFLLEFICQVDRLKK